MVRKSDQPFASLFEDADTKRIVTRPDHPAALRRRSRGTLLVDPATSSPTGKTFEVDLAPASPTMEVNSNEYREILRAAAALQIDDLGRDPFGTVNDAPDFEDKSRAPTLECPPWDERDADLTINGVDLTADAIQRGVGQATLLSAPRPITLAGDDLDLSPRAVTFDGILGQSGDDLMAMMPEPSIDADDAAILEEFPFESPPPLPEDASFDDAIRQAVDPFGFGGGHPVLDEQEEVTGEWTNPALVEVPLKTRVSAPLETDLNRGRELYLSALENLAMKRRAAALVQARLALGYDPDNAAYKAFCADIAGMLGDALQVSASGTLPILDADIVSELEESGEFTLR